MEKLMHASLVGDVSALTGLLPYDPLFEMMVHPPVTQTPLHVASLRGHTAFASEMLRLKPELCRTQNSDGHYPIHLASSWGRVDIVRKMVEADKSLARPCDGNGCTALHAAAANNQVEVLSALLKEETGLAKEVTGQGETALHVAVKNHMIGAATHLIEHCKDIIQQCLTGPSDTEIIRSLSHAGCKSGPRFTRPASKLIITTTPLGY
ncbi:hypothetical protein QJS10_CPB18g01110 [Acorus calamus]|uniref:Uncharacterized protein n=1 Tax=Acorus calamus TaxID=4465 RepID=A0AAV9CN84_ACOCL|nr:hypothetical protein QJS10_CPB18g01110 [Acorus calamus]